MAAGYRHAPKGHRRRGDRDRGRPRRLFQAGFDPQQRPYRHRDRPLSGRDRERALRPDELRPGGFRDSRRGPRQGRPRQEAHGPPLQDPVPRLAHAGGAHPEPGRALQRDRGLPHGLRRPRGHLLPGPWRLRPRSFRRGLPVPGRSPGRQRLEQHRSFLLAHANSYINWGEPWYASFRESQSEQRFKHQPFLERNYLPNMLGWFLMTPDTRLEDIEWMLARAAGYRAGYAFVADPEAFEKNPETDAIIASIRTWEEAKQLGIFSDEQRTRLKDPEKDFHLERQEKNRWALQSYEQFRFEHTRKVLQPGQPASIGMDLRERLRPSASAPPSPADGRGRCPSPGDRDRGRSLLQDQCPCDPEQGAIPGLGRLGPYDPLRRKGPEDRDGRGRQGPAAPAEREAFGRHRRQVRRGRSGYQRDGEAHGGR